MRLFQLTQLIKKETIQVGSDQKTWLKQNFLDWQQNRKLIWDLSTREMWQYCWLGDGDKECGGLKELRSLADSRQWNGDLRSTSTQNWILPTTWMSLEVDFPWVSSQGLRSTTILTIALWGPEQRTHWTDDLQNYVLISGCCFKPSCLWYLLCSNRKLTQCWGITYYKEGTENQLYLNATFFRVFKFQSWFVNLFHVEKNNVCWRIEVIIS